jgi:glycosyltransferase involved in cell wall biosynthesis
MTSINYSKLSIFTQFYPPDYAATGQLIEELTNQLGRQGLHVQVFTGQPGYAFQKNSAPCTEKLGKVQIRRSRTARLWPQRIRGKLVNGLLYCLRSMLHLFKPSSHPDVLLVTTAPAYLPVVGYLANLLLKIPYVCLIYDLYPDVAVELKVISSQHWLVRAWEALNRQVWKQAKEIIVLSSTMKERVVSKCPEVADKISVIHSWADPKWVAPIPKSKNWFAQQHDLVEKFTVLYSGNMGRCHDMDTILDAAVRLKDAPIQFVFIGAGAKRKPCLEKVQALGLENCMFLPYQDKKTLPYSLTACDLSLVSVDRGMEGVVAPSKFYGMLAAGRPIAAVCEPHSFLRSILAKANCGQAFNNGDGAGLAQFILKLAGERELAAQMGDAGRRHLLANFTPEIIAQQYAKVLQHEGQLHLDFYSTLETPEAVPMGQHLGWQASRS